ncbi:winged helix-turn-helix domain-containing protein [Rahnella sp. BCC 1045]|uniref:winged helix-turn-helix domain-containing protein n=1 Tax=Rahnella sp. BCC 1045 TaxID=2816251 RepID=UPI001C257FD2|nr:winged helix-turn-helix domain-containing protein [Rahnella sp. BCC 1045]MBU9818413.1 winged helix-turn-helix domain-containing protein [Rahnella sp. BCC 1045]
MTSYLINHKYLYNESTKEITKIHSNKKLKLTFMRAHCLSYIVQHAQDDVISKEELSQAIWGTRSQFTSETSLTQILYLIRRDLKTIGIDKLFMTVPKVGVTVNKEVVIVPLCKNSTVNRVALRIKVALCIMIFLLATTGIVMLNQQ